MINNFFARVLCKVNYGNHRFQIQYLIFFTILCRYFDGYGIIRDIVHSHILQTIALLAMEPPISLDGEDIRNEKVIDH
jgi:hypothetical protein